MKDTTWLEDWAAIGKKKSPIVKIIRDSLEKSAMTETCSDCRGSGTYQGLGKIEDCRACDGTGIRDALRNGNEPADNLVETVNIVKILQNILKPKGFVLTNLREEVPNENELDANVDGPGPTGEPGWFHEFHADGGQRQEWRVKFPYCTGLKDSFG